MIDTKTAVGKGLKTLLWAAVSAGLVAGLSVVVNRPELFSPSVVVLANALLVLFKNVLDPKVENF